MESFKAFYRLDGDAVTAVFAHNAAGDVRPVYLGAALHPDQSAHMLAKAHLRGAHESQPNRPIAPGLLPQNGRGYSGAPAIIAQRHGRLLASDFQIADIVIGKGGKDDHQGADMAQAMRSIDFIWRDMRAQLELVQNWRMAGGDVIIAHNRLTNYGDHPVTLDWLAAVALPLADALTQMTQYAGRWGGEMHGVSRPIAPGATLLESREGRPGFGGGQWLRLASAEGDQMLALHLAHGGDHHTRIERDNDGRVMVQMGARLDPGEIVLAPGQCHATPDAVIALGDSDAALAHSFHTFVRRDVLPDRAAWPARKVHINSWEALGFDLDEARLMALADDAAALGIERFVLDDGWFAGRRNDRNSLGDWQVDRTIFADGLTPLIAHVHRLEMDFGLWVEPEMISRDSDLYRAHPDWCLHLAGHDRPEMRQQLVLDLTHKPVADYLFARLDRLLCDNMIAYLKWDHNRGLFPAANDDGPAGQAQAAALLALIARLRAAHPQIEIESCASGGARIDMAMLRHCHRIWPSDNNDAIERLRIMRSMTQFLPLEILGNHVGPAPNPITGRRLAMDFAAKVALFGHMGVEANPANMCDNDRDILAAHIALYKQHRGLLHNGRHRNLAMPGESLFGQLVIGEHHALALVAQTALAADYEVPPVRLPGLAAARFYRITLPRPWPVKASGYLADPGIWRDGLVMSGAALARHGLALPLTHPETAWLIHLEALI